MNNMNELKVALDDRTEYQKKLEIIKNEVMLKIKSFKEKCTLCKLEINGGAENICVPWCTCCNDEYISSFYFHSDCRDCIIDWDTEKNSILMYGDFILPKYTNIITCNKCDNKNTFGFDMLSKHMRANLIDSALKQKN